MKLYHGTNCSFDEIDLTKSKVGKDFGCGFYLSADSKQAMELAERKMELSGEGALLVYEYEFDEALLQSEELSVLRFEEYSKEWAEFILTNIKNRTRVSAHQYDIVIGPIADDAVGFQIRRFTAGIIDMDRFIQELRYMKGISFQYFFGTDKALKYLKRL